MGKKMTSRGGEKRRKGMFLNFWSFFGLWLVIFLVLKWLFIDLLGKLWTEMKLKVEGKFV